MTAPRDEIIRVLRGNDSFLVASHVNPDGDALGSTAAVGHILTAMGKEFHLYNPTGAPRQFDWVELPGGLSNELPEKGFSWCVVLDCGDLSRVGSDLERIVDPKRIINIDHHLGNPHFGAVNWVETGFSSTGEMTALLAEDLGVELSGPLGEAVYLAVATDTGWFSYNGTRPETLELAARLLRNGLDLGRVNAKIKNQWSLNRIKLWSGVLGDLGLFYDGQVGAIRISRALLDATGTTVEDCDGLINDVLRVRGVKIAVSVREVVPGEVKFSLRSVPDINVQAVAASFGGGGHKNASGGSVKEDLPKARALLVEAAGRALGAANADD